MGDKFHYVKKLGLMLGICTVQGKGHGSVAANSEKTGRVVGAEGSRKLLQLLLTFTPAQPIWTVGDLAEKLGLTQSMAYRYVALLREVGLLVAAPEKGYRVTDLARGLAAAAAAVRPPLGEISLPILTRIRDFCRETIYVTRRSGMFGYVLELAQSNHLVRLIFERGQALVLHQGASSRLLLAAMSPAERQWYFEQYGVDRNKVAQGLLSDEALDELARGGVAESFEEVGEGSWSVAVAIREKGQIVGTIAAAAPLFRVNAEQRYQMKELITRGATEIGESLEYPPTRGRGV
jgi:DNA-binding IclR family transcriptional regulator